MNPKFFMALLKAILIGDVLNAHRLPHPPLRGRCRARPTAALETAKKIIYDALDDQTNVAAVALLQGAAS